MGKLPTVRPIPPQPGSQTTPLPMLPIPGPPGLFALRQRTRLQIASQPFTVQVGPSDDFIIVVASVRSTAAALRDNLDWNMNGDTGNNYSWDQLFQSNGVAGAAGSSAATNQPQIAQCPAATADGSQFGWVVMAFTDLQSTAAFHRGVGWSSLIATFAVDSAIVLRDGYWNQPTPVKSITIGLVAGSFVAGSLFKVYAV